MASDAAATLTGLIEPRALEILLVLSLSFLLGLEREGRKAQPGQYLFGGVRTFPLIGLFGYAVALFAGPHLVVVAFGMIVVGALLLASYVHKLWRLEDAGVTSEVSGLLTYALGPLVHAGDYWIAATIVILATVLLELKAGLEGLTRRIPSEDVLTFAKFLLLSAVILPIVPDRAFTVFEINPFKTWLVVVAVSAVSYGSYVLQRLRRGRGGVLAAALLGGAYSSTVATVALARRSREDHRSRLFAGSILAASGVMYVRLLLLIAVFSSALALRLVIPFLALGAAAGGGGWLWARFSGDRGEERQAPRVRNPLELGSALLFALIFLAVMVLTELARRSLGPAGIYGLAAIMGVTDVDPFILSITQASAPLALHVAAVAVVIAAASNNAIKGVYAWIFADRPTGRLALAALLALALAGLLPLFFA
jgi:uncharacterized membrane protein (DUF4010 family)